MKKYLHPEMELIALDTEDVMAVNTTSNSNPISSRRATFEEDAAETSQSNDVWQWMDK